MAARSALGTHMDYKPGGKRVRYKWLLSGVVIACLILIAPYVVYWLAYDTGVTVYESKYSAEELIVIHTVTGEGFNSSFYDPEGKLVISGDFHEALEFTEGIAVVTIDPKNRHGLFGQKTGYLLPDGTWLIKPRYDAATPFAGGLAIATDRQGCFIINTEGEKTVKLGKLLLPYGSAFVKGIAPVTTKSSGWRSGAANTAGELILPVEYLYASFSDDGLGVAYNGQKAYFFNAEGEIVKEFDTPHVSGFKDGLAYVRYAGQREVIYLDTGFNEVLRLPYDTCNYFTEGLAVVSRDGRRGYIDKTGKEVIPLQFEGASIFSEGLAAVEKGGLWGYIDASGEWVIAPQFAGANHFINGLAAVYKDYEAFDDAGNQIEKGTVKAYINQRGDIVWKEEKWN